MEPSWGHAKRVCKVLKSEKWRQIRLYKDWLKVLVEEGKDPCQKDQTLRAYRRLAGQTTEFLWQRTRLFLTKPPANTTSTNEVTTLGGAKIPDHVEKILKKGPKYSFQPRLNAPQLLAMGRSIGDKADDQDRERVIGEAVDCVLKHAPRKNSGTAPLKKVVTCLKKDALQVIQADKEGGFVVLPETLMKEKSRHAVVKNFKEISFEPKKQKKVALKLLKDMHLNSLRQLVNTADAEFLEVFFTCKTHKPDHPLRVICIREDILAVPSGEVSTNSSQKAAVKGAIPGKKFR